MFERILVAVDGSPASNAAVDLAVRLVHEHPASLWFCHVQVPLPRSVADAAELREAHMSQPEAAFAWSQKVLADAAARAGRAGVAASTLIVDGRDVAAAIVQHALRHRADLIVMGYGRGGIAKSLRGTCADEVARRSPVPVMILPLHAVSPGESEPLPAHAASVPKSMDISSRYL